MQFQNVRQWLAYFGFLSGAEDQATSDSGSSLGEDEIGNLEDENDDDNDNQSQSSLDLSDHETQRESD